MLYARVSCADQRENLERQKARLQVCAAARRGAARGWPGTALIADLGSGMNYRKRGLRRSLAMLLVGEVGRLVVEHHERLLRCGAELVFWLCRLRGVEVVVVEAEARPNFKADLARGVLEILMVFSSRLYDALPRFPTEDVVRARRVGDGVTVGQPRSVTAGASPNWHRPDQVTGAGAAASHSGHQAVEAALDHGGATSAI